MYSEIRISDRAGEAVVDIEGVIGVPEKMQFDNAAGKVATYARFTEALRRIEALDAAEVVVNIRSTGGDVNDALLIYEALAALEGRVVTRCYGYVASAATIIAQAASPGCREIASSTLYLIHCSESVAEGNSGSLSRVGEMLDKTDERIASIYAMRSGRPTHEFAELMNENDGKGSWLSAGEAIAAGLADRVIEPLRVENSAHEEALMASLGAMAAVAGITMMPTLGQESFNCLGDAENEADESHVSGGIAKKIGTFLSSFFGRQAITDDRLLQDGGSQAESKSVAKSWINSGTKSKQEAESNSVTKSGAKLEPAAESNSEPVVSVSCSPAISGESLSGGALRADGVSGGAFGDAASGDLPQGLPVDSVLSGSAAVVRLRQAQTAAAPTRTASREDPSVGEARRNPNDDAYSQDAMGFRD